MADENKKPETEENSPVADEKDTAPKEEKPSENNTPSTENSGDGKEQSDSQNNDTPPTDEKEITSERPELSETDKLKEENFRLKTQLEAMKIGFKPEVIEDAVILAENITKRDGSDIATALQTVAKKYPDWKADAKKGKSMGFQVGIDSSLNTNKADEDEKLDRAFGIKRKG